MADKLITAPSGMTQQELETFVECSKDPFFFSQFIHIIHPIQGKVNFNLYDYQKMTLFYFLKYRFNIVLKFRQAGLTELIAMYCLWLALFFYNKNIQIISIKDRVAKRVLRRIKYMYKNLPWYLQVPIVNGRPMDYGTQSEIEFSNGSTITSIPTTEEAGRSEAVSLLVIDEAAIVKWANQIWASALPTLSCLSGSYELITCKNYKQKSNKCIKDGELKGLKTQFMSLKELCPKEIGVKDISKKDLYTLTHLGRWKKITHTVNKGYLETWEVRDNRNNKLDGTPAHRLLTTSGWKSIKEIIDFDLNVIQVNTGVNDIIEKPLTIPPKREEIEEINEILSSITYYVSNLGNIYKKDKLGNIIKVKTKIHNGYRCLTVFSMGKTLNFKISQLVAKYFIGDKPTPNHVIDHINCNPLDDYVTNLRYITQSKNVKRGYQYNLNTKLGNLCNVDLLKYGLILELHNLYPNWSDKLISEHLSNLGMYVKRRRINSIINQDKVYISKLRFVKKYVTDIYDVQVEDDHSYILPKNNYVNHNTGGSAILNSTPFGVGGLFHKTWVDAVANGNAFNPIRLSWRMHPERDDAWYKTMADALGPRRTAQEIDGDFLTSGNSVFDLVDIKAIEDSLSEVEPYQISMNGSLVRLSAPIRNVKNYIGADVSSGRSRDYSSFTNMTRNGKETSYFKGKLGVGPFADLLMREGKMSNYAVLAPESNDIGLAVTTKIQEHGYPNLYYTTQFLKEKGSSKPKTEKLPGWYTTQKSRPIIIEELESDIRNDMIETYDKFFVQEAYTFIYDESNRPVAMGKGSGGGEDIFEEDGGSYVDDSILGKAITNHIRKGKLTSVVVSPQ